MKKKLCFLMAIAMMMTVILLTACGNTEAERAGSVSLEDSSVFLPAASISNEQDEFAKKIVPLNYEAGEQAESLYYRTVIEDSVVYYEVQPEGEERFLVPVSETVIYIVNDVDECQVVKTTFEYALEDSDPILIEQYRIFATPSTINISGDSQNVDFMTASGEDETGSKDTSAIVEGIEEAIKTIQ